MSAVFALLLDISLKASLLCLAGLLLAVAARRASAALRHDLWLAVLGCSALLPLVSALPLLVGPLLPAAPVHQVAMAVAPRLPAAVPAGTVELLDQIWSGDGGALRFGWLAPWLVAIWLAGIALAAVRAVRAWREAAAIVRRAAPFPHGATLSPIPLRVTTELSSPAVFGALAPVILLPAEALRWPAARLAAVLAHETTHVERGDGRREWVAQLVAIVHWYNPLVHGAAARLRCERELACDERVVAAGLDPRAYAATLVEVAREAFAGRAALLAMARPTELERRVGLLLRSGGRSSGAGRLRAAWVWLAIALFLPFAALTAPTPGLLAAGSVQPGDGPLSGLDDPLSELVPLPYERLAPAAAAVPAIGPEQAAIAALKLQLGRESRGPGDLVRERAIWALTRIQDGRLFDGVADHVADPDWRLRAYAAWALAATGDRRATLLLLPLLDDPVWRVRAMAAAALADLADPRAAEAMAGALDDPAWQVRIGAVEYVERRGDPALLRRLRPLRRDPHGGTRLRAEAVHASH